MTGLLGTHGRLFQDWSADYRLYQSEHCDPHALFRAVRQSLMNSTSPKEALVLALDDTRVRKTGPRIHGVKYTRDPMGPKFHVNFIRAQRFLQLSMAAGTPGGDARMVPIDLQHAPTPPKPRRDAQEDELRSYHQQMHETALPRLAAQRVKALHKQLEAEGEGDRPLWTVVDGGYTNGTYLKTLDGTCTVVGRIRSDAKLYHLPESTAGKVGRNQVYGERAPTPNELREDDCVPWQEVHICVSGETRKMRVKTLGPLRWRPAGKAYDLKLVVVAPLCYRINPKGKHLYRSPAYLICTDPQASVEDILQNYVRRWDIEVNFRDQKTLLGVGEAQVRSPQAVQKVPALATAAYAALLCASIQVFGHHGIPDTLPKPKWQRRRPRRATTPQLLNHLRQEVWAEVINFSSFEDPITPHTKPEKSKPDLNAALFYAIA